MYKDYFPPLDVGIMPPTPVVAVITTNERVRPKAIMAVCERYGAISNHASRDGGSEPWFWIVFEDEPKTPHSFTENSLHWSVDKDGYIKCRSYSPNEKRNNREETPSYMIGVSISA